MAACSFFVFADLHSRRIFQGVPKVCTPDILGTVPMLVVSADRYTQINSALVSNKINTF